MTETNERVRLFFNTISQSIVNPEADIVTPIIAFANTAEDPHLELVILTVTALQQYALLLTSTLDTQEQALAYTQEALLVTEIEEIYTEQESR